MRALGVAAEMAARSPASRVAPGAESRRQRYLVDTLPERLVLANKPGLDFEGLLLLILSDEITRRESSSTERRASEAGLDPMMTMERWDTTRWCALPGEVR